TVNGVIDVVLIVQHIDVARVQNNNLRPGTVHAVPIVGGFVVVNNIVASGGWFVFVESPHVTVSANAKTREVRKTTAELLTPARPRTPTSQLRDARHCKQQEG